MATYYRWSKYSTKTVPMQVYATPVTAIPLSSSGSIFAKRENTIPSYSSRGFNCSSGFLQYSVQQFSASSGRILASGNSTTEQYIYQIETAFSLVRDGDNFVPDSSSGETFTITRYTMTSTVPDSFVEYVYSTSSSTYPNDDVSGSYYYSGRTTVTSPTTPSSISYPSPITSNTVSVSWGSSSSNTSYDISSYEIGYALNGSSSYTTSTTSSLSKS